MHEDFQEQGLHLLQAADQGDTIRSVFMKSNSI